VDEDKMQMGEVKTRERRMSVDDDRRRENLAKAKEQETNCNLCSRFCF